MNAKSTTTDGLDAPHYQIRLRSHLDVGWADWFEGLTITLEADGTTLLCGPVPDQAALHGLLRKIRDLGLPLVSVVCVNHASNSVDKGKHDMNSLQRLGGYAALTDALTYVIGLALAFTLVLPAMQLGPAEYVAFMVENQTLLHIWHLLIYIVNGVALVVLVLALHDRLKTRDPAFMQVATSFGLIWVVTILMSGMLMINDLRILSDLFVQDPAQAVVTWRTLSAVESGLGGGVELPGGVWILLVSFSALRTGGLSRGLNVLGMIVGISGILTSIPVLYEAGTIFGLGFILWFAWTGILLLRSRPRVMA